MKVFTRTNGNSIHFSSKEGFEFSLVLHRTLRLPEDDKTHALPPSMGRFPIKKIDDYKDKVPAQWVEHGGIFFPMWQREAMWIGFSAEHPPTAVKIASGKVNAVTGDEWAEELQKIDGARSSEPEQDYLVCPPQPWLDGFNAGDGIIKQFVAMPLGMGYTVEKQITGEETVGGLQVMVIPAKKDAIPEPERKTRGMMTSDGGPFKGMSMSLNASVGAAASATTDSYEPQSRGITKSAEMGFGAGGKMRQKIYADPHGIDVWDQESKGRCFIHIVNSQMYEEITGEKAPKSPISAQSYTNAGLPWFDLYDEHIASVSSSSKLEGVKTIGEKDKEHGFENQQDDSTIDEKNIKKYGVNAPVDKNDVRNGKW